MRAHRRGEYVRLSILSAVIEEIVRRGAGAVTVGAVARRAGVHETTIYRRWGTRENLLLDAMHSASSRAVAVPDTGTVRGDVDALVRMVCAYLRSPVGRGMVRALSIADDDRYTEHRRRFWTERTELMLPVIHRAIVRGELRAEVDPALLLDALVSPLHARLLTTGEPPSDEVALALAGLVLEGARPRQETGGRTAGSGALA